MILPCETQPRAAQSSFGRDDEGMNCLEAYRRSREMCRMLVREHSNLSDGLEHVMWNKNEREGKVDQLKGQVKQAVGDLTADDKLKAEGKADEVVGKAKTAVGVAQEKVGAAIENVGKAVKQ